MIENLDYFKIAGIAFSAVGVIFAISSKQASLRKAALMLVVGLSFASNHWSTYFAAIFIIATAVTELDFLQNLAAIIRGDKNFFDYKKELVGSTEKGERSELEVNVFGGNPIVDQPQRPQERNIKVHPGFISEQLALLEMERLFQTTIERNVRISRSEDILELDGLIQARGRGLDRIFEVKYANKEGSFLRILKNYKEQVERISHLYNKITGRGSVIHFVVVVEEPVVAKFEHLNTINKEDKTESIHILPLSELKKKYRNIVEQDSGGNA